MQTRVKMCGFTQADDVAFAVRAGVNAIGVIAYEPSPRCAQMEQAAKIRAVVPPFVSLVLVTVDMDAKQHRKWIQALQPDCLQFHGRESEQDCLSFALPYIKSLRMRDDIDLDANITAYRSAGAILLDTYVSGTVGGTGEMFDWTRAANFDDKPIILAGGLDSGNVSNAIEIAKPYAVDISSSLEKEPGKKDHRKVLEFMSRVCDTNCTNV